MMFFVFFPEQDTESWTSDANKSWSQDLEKLKQVFNTLYLQSKQKQHGLHSGVEKIKQQMLWGCVCFFFWRGGHPQNPQVP